MVHHSTVLCLNVGDSGKQEQRNQAVAELVEASGAELVLVQASLAQPSLSRATVRCSAVLKRLLSAFCRSTTTLGLQNSSTPCHTGLTAGAWSGTVPT